MFVKRIACLLVLSLLLLLPRMAAAQSPAETVLHTFNSYADGDYPQGNLIQGSDGNLYGTTELGGA